MVLYRIALAPLEEEIQKYAPRILAPFTYKIWHFMERLAGVFGCLTLLLENGPERG